MTSITSINNTTQIDEHFSSKYALSNKQTTQRYLSELSQKMGQHDKKKRIIEIDAPSKKL